jgi:hypothetical protein
MGDSGGKALAANTKTGKTSAEEVAAVLVHHDTIDPDEQDLSVSGSVVDPTLFLTLHIDRETVDAVCTALSRVDWPDAAAGQPVSAIVNGFRELLQEWLNDVLDE